MKANNFNFIAPLYDRLAGLVFGGSLRQAQSVYLSQIDTRAKVLILGGGTGWLLEILLAQQPGVEVDYIEASEEMLKSAMKRMADQPGVNFIHGTEVDVASDGYGCIVTPFLLDVFEASRLNEVISGLKNALSPEGMWICTDFRNTGIWWHRWLLWLMHRFFKLVSSLESSRLNDIDAALRSAGLEKQSEALFKRGLIFSAVYRKKRIT